MKKPTEETTTSEPVRKINYKNDSPRLKEEWLNLPQINEELVNVIFRTCDFCRDVFKKEITITMVYRTQEEQDLIYKDDPKYKLKKFTSPHQYHHAVDLRSSTFTSEEIEKLVTFLNTVYNSSNYYSFTALCHDIGIGEHLHIQFLKK